MAGELEGKVAVVTGGANGLGRATAELFLQHGARVVIGDIAEDGADVARELGTGCRFLRTDVGNGDDLQALVDLAASEFGRLDVMCNNAAMPSPIVRLLDDPLDDFDRIMRVNIYGVMRGTQVAARHMQKTGGGSIINTASIAGTLASFGVTMYRASKAAVVRFTRTAAIELAEYDIRVNCLVPGQIDTRLIKQALSGDVDPAKLEAYEAAVRDIMKSYQPIRRRGQPRDAAEAALFLAGERSSYITGIAMPVDGGITAGDSTNYIAKYAEAARLLSD
jgi:NAD(P)-dependent dehydrogenase (short-subunit alcohol dehydrogenase family)